MLRLRTRMAITALAASATALIAVLLLVGPGLRQRATDHEREALFAEARLMARVVEAPLARGAGSDELDPIVDAAAREVRARVTIVALDGRVLADSALSGEALRTVENHGSRPEVQEAFASGSGSSQRRSATVQEQMLYSAVAVKVAGSSVGVVRVALPLTGVEAQVRELRGAVALALLLAFVITAIIMIFVIPAFKQVFSSFGADLPTPTFVVMAARPTASTERVKKAPSASSALGASHRLRRRRS